MIPNTAGFYRFGCGSTEIAGPSQAPGWAYRPQWQQWPQCTYTWPCMGVYWAESELEAEGLLGVSGPGNSTGPGFYWLTPDTQAWNYTNQNRFFYLHANECELYQQRGWDTTDEPVVSMYGWKWFDDIDAAFTFWGQTYVPPQWEQNRYYEVNAVVSNGGNRYLCTQAGTSEGWGDGPIGTGTGIEDGSCVWDYLP